MAGQVDRRVFIARSARLLTGAALCGGALYGAQARAQSAADVARGIGNQLLGGRLPDGLNPMGADGPIDLVRTAQSIIALEREADLRRLPRSILSGSGPFDLASVREDMLYALALPRLVALVDRAERRDLPFADRAGGLLARLHASQHEIPEALRQPPLANLRSSTAGEHQALGLIDPPAPPVAESPSPTLPPPALPADIAPLPGDAPVETPIETPVEAPAPAPEATAPPLDAQPETLPPAETQPAQPMRHSTRYAELQGEYARLFASAVPRPEHAERTAWHLAMMRRARARYEAVGARVAIPWYFIAAAHGLEASFNFRAHLHNGDFPLNSRTRQVPSGRPSVWLPPSDWESSAIDAMRLLGFAQQSDWSLPRTLYRLEAYNGFGYRRFGVPTPYLWSFSNHYERGKFVADGRWSATARSQQCGAAVMIKLLADGGDIHV